jgi:hypothetical protein
MKEWSFPYTVERLADLPDSLRQGAEPVLEPSDPINSIIVIPRHTQTKVRRQPFVPQQALVFTAAGLLHAQEAGTAAQPPVVTYLTSADLLYAHHSLILLYGRLELAGATRGELARIVVEYNTVGQYLLQPALSQFLGLALGSPPAAQTDGDRTEILLNRLGAQSFKFSNGLRFYALQPNERLLGFIFQPRLVRRHLRLFHQLIAPATLLALTDLAVILIEEERTTPTAHGWLITICPRRRIASIESKPNKEWRDVCVRLTGDNLTIERQMTVDNETALAWEALWLSRDQNATPTGRVYGRTTVAPGAKP